MESILIILLLLAVIGCPILILVGIVMLFNRDAKHKRTGKYFILAGLLIILIGFAICSKA